MEIWVKDAGEEDEVKACIVSAVGKKIDCVALLDYRAYLIPWFAVPRFIETMEFIPKFATEKIQQKPLRQAGVTERTWDRAAVGYKIACRV